ncbi:MAG: aspartate/glutamate racemase family protein [Demequinaceae bacterium]|nr:aspartate/glutamate racemase family protein [Demequinaceae bacterium]
MSRHEIGVIGGLGPAATAEFLYRVIRWTEAKSDQEHADLVVLQHSSIPDRTRHILDPSLPDPGPVLAADAARLEAMGVSAIVVPCNTARVFIDEIEGAVGIPVVDIVRAAVDDVVTMFPEAGKVGVLATTGTVRSETYRRALEEAGREAVVPSDGQQEGIMELIYGQVKANLPADRGLLDGAIEDVASRGAEAFILGCTELSVAAGAWDMGPKVVDALDSLARRTVTLAGCAISAS